MRLALSALLIGLLATCPIVCGTAHALSGDGDAVGHHHGRHDNSSLPAPANDDDCLCNGALKATDCLATVAPDPASHPLALPDGPPTLVAPGWPAAAESFLRWPPPTDAVSGGARRPFLRC